MRRTLHLLFLFWQLASLLFVALMLMAPEWTTAHVPRPVAMAMALTFGVLSLRILWMHMQETWEEDSEKP